MSIRTCRNSWIVPLLLGLLLAARASEAATAEESLGDKINRAGAGGTAGSLGARGQKRRQHRLVRTHEPRRPAPIHERL